MNLLRIYCSFNASCIIQHYSEKSLYYKGWQGNFIQSIVIKFFNKFKSTIMSNSKAVLGFLAGAAAGAVLGILFAPDKGTDTRKKIARKTSDASESLKDTFGDFVDGLKDTYSGAKSQAKSVYDEGKSRVNDLKRDANQAMNS